MVEARELGVVARYAATLEGKTGREHTSVLYASTVWATRKSTPPPLTTIRHRLIGLQRSAFFHSCQATTLQQAAEAFRRPNRANRTHAWRCWMFRSLGACRSLTGLPAIATTAINYGHGGRCGPIRLRPFPSEESRWSPGRSLTSLGKRRPALQTRHRQTADRTHGVLAHDRPGRTSGTVDCCDSSPPSR